MFFLPQYLQRIGTFRTFTDIFTDSWTKIRIFSPGGRTDVGGMGMFFNMTSEVIVQGLWGGFMYVSSIGLKSC